jgi:hypothetical protein
MAVCLPVARHRRIFAVGFALYHGRCAGVTRARLRHKRPGIGAPSDAEDAWFAFLDSQLRAGHNGAGLRIRCRRRAKKLRIGRGPSAE